MTITAQDVKILRERTGVGLADCKNALTEANGDMEIAIEVLRKKGIAKAAKRADNETKEGKIKIRIAGNVAFVVSVSCETDFVSRNDTFDAMEEQFLDILASAPDEASALASVEAVKGDYVLKTGENLRVNVLSKFEGEAVESYVHSNNKVASLVFAKAGTSSDKLKQVAMHITAMNPEVLRPADIADDLVAKEREIALAQMHDDPKNASKPAEILEKIIEGKMKKFREENALLSQPFVVEPDKTVGQYIGMESLTGFRRFAI